jgi:uncharacterized protein (DUF1330 family)
MAATDAARTRQLNPDQLDAFQARKDEGPVRMLNLLKFKPDGGFQLYMQYAEATGPLLEKVGASIVYSGRPAELLIGKEDWDLLAIVEYPTRNAFLQMVGSSAYQAIEHLRHDALVRSVLYATDPL